VRKCFARVAGTGWVLSVLLANQAAAQTPVAPVEHVDFNRPEAWALKYFTSTTLLTGLDTPGDSRPGAITVGAALSALPALNAAERRVGFNGTKEEDLNKAPIFARALIKFSLPSQLTLTVAFSPPIAAFGLTPRLLAGAVERPLYQRNGWSLGWRTYGQVGTVSGAFTCPTKVLKFAAGSENNSYGCDAESSDVATLRYAGAELGAARKVAALGKIVPHVTIGANYINSVFQVQADTFGFVDRTRLQASGATWSLSAGAGYALTSRLALAADVFYSPLFVQPRSGAAVSNRSLLTARGLLTYRVR
jgi:hypothetical protein